MRNWFRNNSRLLLASLLTAILLAFILRVADIRNIAEAFLHLSMHWVAIGFVAYVISYIFLAIRWRCLIRSRKIKWLDIWAIVSVHNAANNILPARLGEASYLYLMKTRHKLPLEEGIATLLTARVFDLVAMATVFILAFLVSGREAGSSGMVSNTVMAMAMVGLFVSFFFVLIHHGHSLVVGARQITDRLGMGRYTWLQRVYDTATLTVSSLGQINSPKYWSTALTLSILVFGARYLVFYSLFLSMGVTLAFWKVVLGSSLFGLAALLPIQGVAGFGTTEASWAIIFATLGLSKETAVSSGFVYHAFLIVCYLVLGGCGLLLLRRSKAKSVVLMNERQEV